MFALIVYSLSDQSTQIRLQASLSDSSTSFGANTILYPLVRDTRRHRSSHRETLNTGHFCRL